MIVSSLVTAVLVLKYRLEVTAEQLGGLLSAMALLTDEDSRTCPGYVALQAEFKDPRCECLSDFLFQGLKTVIVGLMNNSEFILTLCKVCVTWQSLHDHLQQNGYWLCLCCTSFEAILHPFRHPLPSSLTLHNGGDSVSCTKVSRVSGKVNLA